MINDLPYTYTVVPPVTLRYDNPTPPIDISRVVVSNANEDVSLDNWVNTLEVTLAEETFDPKKTNVSWSGYHAGMQTSGQRPPAVIGLLTMFIDNAHSVSMVKHGMDMLKKQHYV